MSDRKVISSSLNVNTIEDGTSPCLAVLDNTMDSVACNYQGLVTTEQTIEVNASFYLGSTKQIIPLTNGIVCKINGITLTSSYGASGTIAYNYKAIITNLGTNTAHIVIYVREQTSITSSVDIVVTVSSVVDGETVSQDVVLTINGIKAGQNGESPVIYNCLPNPTNVNVKRTSTGGYSPRYTTVRCGYTKKVGDTQTTVQDASGDIDNMYRVFFRRIARSTGIAENTYYYYNDSTYRYYVLTTGSNNGFDTQTYSGVEFIIYKDTTNSSFAANSLDAAKLIDRQTVSVVSDGRSAPQYTKEYYAWSSKETTTDANEEPKPNSGWSTSIGAQGAYAYLWKKVETYTLSSSGSYSVSTTQYFRMTGTSGTSINTKGEVDYAATTVANLPTTSAIVGKKGIAKNSANIYLGYNPAPDTYAWTAMSTASANDAYTVKSGNFGSGSIDGHLIQLNSEANTWVDLGQFKGQDGTTYYTHIVWASNVTFSGGVVQTITGYLPVKPEGDTEHPWMGVHVDTNNTDPIEGDNILKTYTWSNTKGDTGATGDPAAVALATPDKISVPCNVDGGVSSAVSMPMSFSMRIGNTAATNVRVSPPSSMPTGVSYSGSTQNTGTITIATSATATGIAGGVTFTVIGSDGTKDYTATVTVALIGAVQGGQGERGRTGRFYYYGGDWNANNNTKKFVIDDAQTVYFSKAGSSSNQYYLFDYIADSYQEGGYTMYEMWNSLTVKTGKPAAPSWKNKPWEAMTNDFKYLITEAIFADFAKLGSFVISGDWMLSTNGKINGTGYNDGAMYNGAPAYTWFDPDYPNVDHTKTVTIGGKQVTVHNFIPNFCVDGLTGETYQQNAHVEGEIRATSGTIGGFIISPTQISSDNNNIVLNSNGTATITGTINATNGSITGQMNIGTGGSIIVGSDNSGKYRIKISQNSNNGQISMINKDGNNIVLINYDTNKSAGQIRVSEADATHQRYTFVNPYSVESLYNYKNDNNQWNGDFSHITTQVGRRMAETEYEDSYLSGGSGARKYIKIGVGTNSYGNSIINLRAYNDNGDSAWPTVNWSTGVSSMTKGMVHVLRLSEIKTLFDSPNLNNDMYNNCYVLLVRA